MLDTMTVTKVAASLCMSLLVLLLGQWVADGLYSMDQGNEYGPAYVIDLGDTGGEVEEDTGPVFAELYAVADVGSGERVFGKCKACHALDQGANGTGPYLYGVVGRNVDAAEGFGYSGALSEVVDVWTPEHLDAFLLKPKTYAPGTTMSFNGLAKPEDRANVIAYLDATDGEMTEVSAPEAGDEEDGASLDTGDGETDVASTDEAAAE
ncbi:MAG: cytochrome c family protein [Pseudomonadota bacterium]